MALPLKGVMLGLKKVVSVILAAVCMLVLAAGCASSPSVSPSVSPSPAPEKGVVIPYPSGYELGDWGASAYDNCGDHADSPYFAQPDIYNMTSGGSLVVLPKYATYQQTTEGTCGPAAALTVLYHFGLEDWDEDEIAEIMQTSMDLNGSNTENPGRADERGEWGTSTDRMLQFFNQIDWNVTSSLTEAGEDGYSFEDPADFTAWVLDNLNADTPIMVEWVDWMGHWQVIIGYDTMGTEGFGDDVLLMADPYDTSDHAQDGYFIVPAERFFYMWQDKGILPEDQEFQQWLIATPKN